MWATTVTNVRTGQLVDVIEGRTATAFSAWFNTQDEGWVTGLVWGVLDLSGPYRKVYDETLPHVAQVADPFHLIKLANQVLDEVRRRVQVEQLGGRGVTGDPLYGARKSLVMASERLTGERRERLDGLSAAGDPHGEVRDRWHVKEVVRSIYAITDPDEAQEFVAQLGNELQDNPLPREVNRLGRTITRWAEQISNWHRCRLSNGPAEGVNNRVKRVKRTAFGITNFKHLRIRALLYAGGVNWDLLDTIKPR